MIRSRPLARVAVGVFSVLVLLVLGARFGVKRMQRNARNRLAYATLTSLAGAAVETYKRTGRICATGTKRYVPGAVSEIVATDSEGYASSPSEWADPADVAADRGFPCLHFVPENEGYGMHFRIGYTGTGDGSVGSGFEGTAEGDWNHDGVESTFRIVGTVNASHGVDVSPIEATNPDD